MCSNPTCNLYLPHYLAILLHSPLGSKLGCLVPLFPCGQVRATGFVWLVIATGNFPCVIGNIPCYNSMYTTLACTASIERLLCYLLPCFNPTRLQCTPFTLYHLPYYLPSYYPAHYLHPCPVLPTVTLPYITHPIPPYYLPSYYLPHTLPTLLSCIIYSDS